jgi:putative endonuclease
MYYVYVLRSQLDEKLYIGYTMNLNNRMREHNNGEVISTKSRRPLELIFDEGYKSMEDAKRRERYFKTVKGKSSSRPQETTASGRGGMCSRVTGMSPHTGVRQGTTGFARGAPLNMMLRNSLKSSTR